MQQQVRARMMPIPLRVLLAAQPESDLPGFVKDEFEAFLECGILAHGFLRVRCAECAHEKLVAFSCKRRRDDRARLRRGSDDYRRVARCYAFARSAGPPGVGF